MGRLEMEVIASIRQLDATSARLITETNALTLRILWLTVVSVVLLSSAGAVAFAPLFRR